MKGIEYVIIILMTMLVTSIITGIVAYPVCKKIMLYAKQRETKNKNQSKENIKQVS